MRGDRLRRWLIGGALLASTGCATSEDLSTWREHSSHFASAAHMQFSLRNLGEPPRITPEDTATAQVESWWGELVPAADRGPMARAADIADRRPPVADIAGHWTGSWRSIGKGNFERGSIAVATLAQTAGTARGTLMFADAIADENVPYSLRWAGSFGVPVVLNVVGSDVSLEVMRVSQPFTATLRAEGDEIVGRIGSTQIRLTRVR
jgi:hypothetical protein